MTRSIRIPPRSARGQWSTTAGALIKPSRLEVWVFLALFVSGAVPYRLAIGMAALPSIAVLDVVILVAAAALLARLLHGADLEVGDPWILFLLAIPFGATCISLFWSLDVTSTVRAIIIYLESLIAYLVVVNAGKSLSTHRLVQVGYLFTLLLIIPGVLMWLRVPGFEPQLLANADDESVLIGYYARFSHPFIGRSNNLASVLAFVIFLFAGWAIAQRSRKAAVIAVLAAAALVATLSRGVLLAVLLALPVMAVASWRALAQLSGAVIVIAIIGWISLAAVTKAIPVAGEYLEDRMSVRNISARFELLDDAVVAIGERPLLGIGGGASAAVSETLAGGAHNTYVEQLLYFGIPIGVVVGSSLLFLPSRLRFVRAGYRRGIMRKAAASALYCQLIVFLTQTSFEASILRILFYMLIAYALLLIARESEIDDRELTGTSSA